MQSKKSSFSINRAIFKRNMKALWPVSLLYLIYLLLFVVMQMNTAITSVVMYNPNTAEAAEKNAFLCLSAARSVLSSITEPVSVAVFAVMAVLCAFGYLYRSRSGNMMHSFPVTKGILFTTNTFSALVLLVIPQVITYVITVFMTLAMGVNVAGHLSLWLMFEVLYDLFFIGFAAFIAMFTGQAWVVVLLYAAFNAVYAWGSVLWCVIKEMLSVNLIISDQSQPNIVSVFTPLVYLMRRTGFSYENMWQAYEDTADYVEATPIGISTALIYAGIGCGLMIAAYAVYRYRANERSGDFLSIPVTKPLFRFCAGLFGGCAAGVFIVYLMFSIYDTGIPVLIVFIILFVFLFYCVAEMFVQKSYRIFNGRFFAEVAVCLAVVCGLIGYARIDAVQASKYVPDAAKVRMAGIDENYVIATEHNEDIKERILEINKFVVDNYDELMTEMEESRKIASADYEIMDYYAINLRFVMDNGKLYDKSLWFYSYKDDTNSVTSRLRAMCDELEKDPECLKSYLFTEDYDKLKVESVSCWNSISNDDIDATYDDSGSVVDMMAYVMNYISASKELRQKFYETVLEDIDDGNTYFEQYDDDAEYMVNISFTSDQAVYDTAQKFWGNGSGSKEYNTTFCIGEKTVKTAAFIQDVLESMYNTVSDYKDITENIQ